MLMVSLLMLIVDDANDDVYHADADADADMLIMLMMIVDDADTDGT